MIVLPDRLELLRDQTQLTGIDFVAVSRDQLTIDVYFHVDPDRMTESLANDLDATMLTISSPRTPEQPVVPVRSISWPTLDGRRVLRMTVDEPGDFVLYRFAIDHRFIDPFFADVPLDFKAACRRFVDCEHDDPFCPDPDGWQPDLDYTARDFWALRRAMFDLASMREPRWQDRNEADVLVMLTEALASIGDELAYTQDRYRWESNLFDATQRRSQRRHAQLVDHRVHDGAGASTWLVVIAAGSGAGSVAAGTGVSARSDDGSTIPFAIGDGLRSALDGDTHPIDARRNQLVVHIADDDHACLPRGSTELWVIGALPLSTVVPTLGDPPVRMALHVSPVDRSMPVHTHYVEVIDAEHLDDPLVDNPATGNPPLAVTRLRWHPGQATVIDIDLTSTVVYGNVLAATSGSAIRLGDAPTRRFVIGRDTVSAQSPAVERTGPNGTTTYLVGLDDDLTGDLAWRPTGEHAVGSITDPRRSRPEIHLEARRGITGSRPWDWRSTLVGPTSSTSDDVHFAIDDGTVGEAGRHRRATSEFIHHDMIRGTGHTIRFGDGEFGSTPPVGTEFDLWYRTGNGLDGNVAPGAIRHIDTPGTDIDAVINLDEVVDGREPESIVDVRRTAPHTWREVSYRAVRTEDYAEAIARLEGVQAAGAVSRWTGSWTSVIATPDPVDASTLTPELHGTADRQIDLFRQAGRDAWVATPDYADIDLVIHVCVDRAHVREDVAERVLHALVGDPNRPDLPFFFDPDHFVFGTPLDRGRLEAAVQLIDGVKMVEQTEIRRAGLFEWRPFTELRHPVGDSELVRVLKDPNHPTHGTVRIRTRGGA